MGWQWLNVRRMAKPIWSGGRGFKVEEIGIVCIIVLAHVGCRLCEEGTVSGVYLTIHAANQFFKTKYIRLLLHCSTNANGQCKCLSFSQIVTHTFNCCCPDAENLALKGRTGFEASVIGLLNQFKGL